MKNTYMSMLLTHDWRIMLQRFNTKYRVPLLISSVLISGLLLIYFVRYDNTYSQASATSADDDHCGEDENYFDEGSRPWVVIAPTDTDTEPGELGTYQSTYKNPCWYTKKPYTSKTIRCMPKCYALGVGKSGSTTLCQYLKYHQDIVEPMGKELGFWDQGTKEQVLSNYVPMFQNAAKEIFESTIQWGGIQDYHHKITYDCTPRNVWRMNYLPEAIFGTYRRTKLLIIMRNPTDRLYSHYHHERTRLKMSFDPKQFHQTVEKEIRKIKNCEKTKSIVSCVRQAGWDAANIHYSLYYAYAKAWLAVFPPQQILFIKAEELYEHPEQVMRGVYRFLELNVPSKSSIDKIEKEQKEYFPPGMGVLFNNNSTLGNKLEKYHQNETQRMLVRMEARSQWETYKDTMWPSTRDLLDDFYRPYNKMLADLLKDDRFLFQ